MDTIIASLDDLVGDQLQPVSYKWLARHFDVPYDVSKQILFHYLSKKSEKVKAIFLVSGWTKDEEPRHVVRLVDGGALEDAKAQLTVITAMHVYSVQPATSKDANGLYGTEFSQSEELFRKMVAAAAADQDGNPLGCRLSNVRCADSQRAAVAVAGPPALNPAVVPAVKKTTTPTPAVKPKAAAAAAKKEAAPAKKKAEPKPKAASTVAAAKKKADSKPSAATTKKDAPVKSKRTIVDDSEDSEDEEKTTETAEEPAAAAAAAPPPAKKAKQAPAKAAKKPAAAGSKRKQPTIEESNAAGKAAGEEKEAASAKEASKAGTVKVHVDQPVGKRKKRVMKTYFNDAGEEVTEMTEETDDEAPEPQVAEQKEDSKPSPQAENKAPGGASGSTKPASEAPAGASAPSGGGGGGGGKKAAKNAAGAANQRSIASFFSKK